MGEVTSLLDAARWTLSHERLGPEAHERLRSAVEREQALARASSVPLLIEQVARLERQAELAEQAVAGLRGGGQ